MNGPPPKTYFVRTDPTFDNILDWVNRERQQDRLRITGYREIYSDHIEGNGDDVYYWFRPYDFARTAHVTMRYHMLYVADLLQWHDPDASQPSRGRNINLIVAPPPPLKYGRALNHQNHLSANAYETQWVSAHYDMLFPHFHIENQINGMAVNQVRNLHNQMVVVDYQYYVVWNFVITLQVRRLDGGDYRFDAKPFLAVFRLETQQNAPFNKYPFPPTHSFKISRDTDIEEIQKKTRDLKI